MPDRPTWPDPADLRATVCQPPFEIISDDAEETAREALWSCLFSIAAKLVQLDPIDTSHARGNDDLSIMIRPARVPPITHAIMERATKKGGTDA